MTAQASGAPAIAPSRPTHNTAMSSSSDPSPRLLDALASLNHIGRTVNRIGSDPAADSAATLRLIVESAVQVAPDSSAVIYAYDPAAGGFDLASRVTAGPLAAPAPGDGPRPDGLGQRAVDERRTVLSYQEAGQAIHPVQAGAGAQVAACFPLVVADTPLGILYVYLPQPRTFSPLELLMLENFVNQAAMAIFQARQLARVQADLARTADELTRLRRADLLISSRLRLSDTLEAILQMALEVTGAHYGILRLVDSDGRKLLTAAVAGDLSRPAVEALPINTTSIMGWAARRRQPLLIHDLRAEPWARIYYPLDHETAMRSELAVPLIAASGRLEGVLNLESPAVGAFSEQDSRLLQALATQAVIAIQEVRLLDALQEIAERLLTQPPQQVFDRLVGMACELLNAPVGSIWVLAQDHLTLQASNSPVRRGERLSLHHSLTGQAILRRGPITVDDLSAEPRFAQRALAAEHGWAGALIVPLQADEQTQPLGAFSVYSRAGDARRFAEAEWDKKVLTVLARHAAMAVQEASRREALRASEEQRAVAETFAAVGDIAANLLHRVNNQVGLIPVRVEGIQDKCAAALAADPYLATNLEQIQRSAAEAMTVMRDTLFHLRPIHLMPVHLAECLAEAMAETDLPPTVRVEIAGLESLPSVHAGPRRLSLVFVNLLENAATAMEGAGVISVRGAVNGAWVEVQVSDTGPGIAPELHERIFDFDFSGRRVHPGKLGFGLWWVKTLMARFGGSVAVASDGRHGATFTLRLPAAEKLEHPQTAGLDNF
ncbi:MAG TPA: GAF domain-containing sensor histidine kinase [Anaerolineae bacterium]|nr:GAF domain-containing sensor histidine kinase [Anaerolineae bacterium]HNU02780.1 GAF domain-containing sensor histidine kinase [Anaerolineae bacterium]